MGLNAWIYGPAGVGKTAGVEQFAARLGRPFIRIAIDRTTEAADLIGQSVPAKGGGMRWEDGKLTRAFRIPQAVILIDEPSLLRSGTLATIQTALDHRALFLVTGETVRAAPGVFIVAADNTAGCGDDSGRYVDTAPLNAAFMDRFALKTAMGFLTVSQETTMIAARAGVHASVARIMVEYANSTRVKADSGHLTMGVTPRRLVAWAKAVKAGLPSAKAWQSVIVTGAAPEDREALIALESTDLRGKHATIDGIARGTIDPNAPARDAHAQGGIGPTAFQFPDDNESQA
jgi:MoxR-like ATPase